jgi:clusterin-associated protein 1
LFYTFVLFFYYDRCVREIIQQQADSKAEMLKYVQNLENDERTLDERIKKKTLDLERAEKRLKTISNVKPAFMDEYERLEKDLEKIYNVYLDKFRNLDYLEHQLDLYNQAEQEKFEDSQRRLEKLADKIKDEEMKMLRGDQEVGEFLRIKNSF